MYWWWVARSIGGTIVFFANLLFVINIYNTIVLKPVHSEHELTPAKI